MMRGCTSGFIKWPKSEQLRKAVIPCRSAGAGGRLFPGYHIRRGNLVSILLEGSVSLDEICSWIDKSYQVTASAKTKHDTSGVDMADGLSAQPDDDR